MKPKPKYPLTVKFENDYEKLVFNDESETACTLEFFDSEDPDEKVTVTDASGQPVRLKVEMLEVLLCEIK
jgi:hypothetical protein